MKGAERFLHRQRRRGMKLGLRNMAEAMARLRHPEGAFTSVLVAGSKGKGSVCTFLESILLAAGHQVGLYTSPHLVRVTERIRVGGVPVSERRFALLVRALRKTLQGEGAALTYFEWLTAMAIRYFRDCRVPLALFEVGLGGRLDATNIVPAALSIVTEIEKEHTEYLGTTLAEIAREKCGIIKKGGLVLSGASSPAARREIARVAVERGARPGWLDDEADWAVTAHSLRGVRMDLSSGSERYRGLRLGVLGRHQARNAALAVRAAQELRGLGFAIGKLHVRAGLARARCPGRCEYRPGRPPLVLDGAHTPASARALVETLDELFPRRPRVLLFGVLGDKDIASLASRLFPGAETVVLARPPEERGASPAQMMRRLPLRWRGRCRAAGDTGLALDEARRAAGPGGVVVVTGSFFLVGDIMKRLSSR